MIGAPSPGIFALPDLRTVLVDADPCRPRLHEIMGPGECRASRGS
jgi:hypothetical protein